MQPYIQKRKPYADLLPSTDRRARRVVRRNLKRSDKSLDKKFEERAEAEASLAEFQEFVQFWLEEQELTRQAETIRDDYYFSLDWEDDWYDDY